MTSWMLYSKIIEIEEEFVSFYGDVIKQMYNDNLKMSNLSLKCEEALTIITQMNSNLKDEEKRYYNYVHFRECPIRFSYVFLFSIINTCTAYQHFLNFFYINKDLKRIMKTKSSIRICCLGGGPGVEAVALCKIINDFFKATFSTSSCTETANANPTSQVSVHVTIVDICSHWLNEAFRIMNAMTKSTIVDSEHLTIKTRFIQADLLERFETDLMEEMKEADIITMIRLGKDIIKEKSYKLRALCESLSRIVKLMKVDSCLFIQESSRGPAFCHLKNSLCRMTITNVESYEDIYSLQQASREKFKILAPIDFVQNEVFPITMSTASSCIWVRTKPSQKEEISRK